MRAFCFVTLLFSAGWLLPVSGVAQEKEDKIFTGVVLDSLDKTPLENCTLTLGGARETAERLITSEKGIFSFTSKADTVTLFLQHVGYTGKNVMLFPGRTKGADTLFLSPSSVVMDEVIVKSKLPPIVVRDDTTEYNIDSTMFDPYDAVEDLLKRLPGLEVDAEGKLSFQGKPITRILVDGEDLFGGDPAFSLKKLPAGLVAKIQVMDTKTLEQIFNRQPVDGEDKTLNIKLKSGNKVFGSAGARAGTKNQAEGDLALSQFNGARRLNATASVNSSNKLRFPKPVNGPQRSAANAGLDYGSRWGGLRFNSSYGYSQNENSNETYRERTQHLTADTAFFTRSNNRFRNGGSGHRFTLGGNLFLDSSGSLDLSLALAVNNNGSSNNASSATTENGLLRNESKEQSSSAGTNQTLSANLSWLKRLNRKGRTLTLSYRTAMTNGSATVFNQSTNTYFTGGLPVSGDTLDRRTSTRNNSGNQALSFSYVEPLGKGLSLGLGGSVDFTKMETDRSIYNLDSVSHTAAYDSLYSAKILSTTNTQNLSASLAYNQPKWSVSAGLSTVMQQTERTLQKDVLRQSLLRYAPSLAAYYALTKEKTVRVNFSAATIQPAIEQLQPVPDNSNPLYVRLGNPALRTAFSQSYGLSYNYARAGNSVRAGLNYSPVSNQIVNSVYYDGFRRQTSRYINVSGVYNLRGNLSLTKSDYREKRWSSWNAASGFAYGQQVYFQSNRQYWSRNYTASGQASFSKREQVLRAASYALSLGSNFSRTWTPADARVLNTERLALSPKIEGSCTVLKFIYATASYSLGYNRLNYHSTLRSNDEYSVHNLTGNLNFQIAKRFSVQSAFSYYYTTQAPEGTPKGLPSLNLFASARVFKGGRGQLQLSAVNLLAPKNDLRRVVGENYTEDVQTNNLQNYFVLKFQYGFYRLEKKEHKAVRSSTK